MFLLYAAEGQHLIHTLRPNTQSKGSEVHEGKCGALDPIVDVFRFAKDLV
jgi:hypothetical protein